MKIRFTGLLLLIGLFMLSACGQKGPLYLEKSASAKSSSTVNSDVKENEAENKEVKDQEKDETK